MTAFPSIHPRWRLRCHRMVQVWTEALDRVIGDDRSRTSEPTACSMRAIADGVVTGPRSTTLTSSGCSSTRASELEQATTPSVRA